MLPPRRPTYRNELVCATRRYADKLSAGSMQSHNLQYAPARYVLHFFHFVKERTSTPGNRSCRPRSKRYRHRNRCAPSLTSRTCFLDSTGGAGRDRTDDLRLAKPPLSQLSYSPLLSRATTNAWWVWLGSNQRPPPYQDGALTS